MKKILIVMLVAFGVIFKVFAQGRGETDSIVFFLLGEGKKKLCEDVYLRSMKQRMLPICNGKGINYGIQSTW